MMGVSTRDLVYLLLSIPFFLIVMLTPSLRLGFSTVIKAFFARKLVIVTLSMLLWISASVVLLKFLSLWNCTHIWPTVVWTAAFAFATLFEATRVSYQKHLGRRVFLESIGVIALVEFFLHLYTFPFLVELLLVPIWLLFSIVYIYTEGKPKHASAKALAGWGLLLISVGIFFYTFYKIITDADNFLSINTLHTFLLPIFLTILYIPFLFMLQSYSLYETVSIRLGNNQTFPKDNLHNYALRKAIVSFFPSLYLLDRWSLHCMQNQSQIETKAGIDGTVELIKSLQKDKIKPPLVKFEDGWSPFLAMNFLDSLKLSIPEYSQIDEEWYGNGNPLAIGDDVLNHNLTYYIEGTRNAAKRLKLKLEVNYQNSTEESIANERFNEAALLLVKASINCDAIKKVKKLLCQDTIDVIIQRRRVQLTRENYPNESGYTKKLIIDVNPTYTPVYS